MLLFQTELLLDALDRARLDFFGMHRQDGLPAIQVHAEVGALRRASPTLSVMPCSSLDPVFFSCAFLAAYSWLPER